MTHAFSRTLRSIEADRSRRGAWTAALALVVLGGWATWLVTARVPVYAASREARLVTERAVYTLEAPVSGRVEAVSAVLEQTVEAGTVLVQLDDRSARLARDEELARAGALERSIESARGVLAASERALGEAGAASLATIEEARLVRRTRELEKQLAEEELSRLERLRESSASELEISEARTKVQTSAVAIQAQDAAIVRLDLEERRVESDRAAQIEALRRDLARDEGALSAARVAAERLEHEIERHRVRAPASGIIGELAPLGPGAYVSAGSRLGTIVAPGHVGVEALFAPADALGRLREGQSAELALDGFPRLEFGALPLSVARVASETREGAIQVELSLSPQATRAVPLEHGLPGKVRVEIERASPATLLLRAVGRRLATRDGPPG